MTRVLNAASQSSYTDAANNVWDYFQDADDPNIYYVAPKPGFSVSNGLPRFHLTEYVDSGGGYLSALLQVSTILAVPDDVVLAVAVALRQKGVPAPAYQTMPYIDVVGEGIDPNMAFLNFSDKAGMVSRTAQARPSLSGSQIATFGIDNLSRTETAFLKSYFGGDAGAGTVQVVYQLTVWARLGEVSAHVHFDAKAAYDYQRTYKWVSLAVRPAARSPPPNPPANGEGPTMATFFHQNMRIFGGGAPARNAAYNGVMAPGGAFAAINGAIGGPPAGPIAVAGFTEITNNIAAPAALALSAVSLGMAGGLSGAVACGRTALAHGPEYVGIAVNAGWPILTVGRLLLTVVGQTVTLTHQRAATFAALNAQGLGAATPDYRGLAYVIVTIPGGGPNVAIGFLHNLYTLVDQRILVAGQLPFMAREMGAAVGGLGPIAVAARYIGGDFNVNMITPRGTVRQGRLYGHSAGLAAVPPGAVAGGTTWSGSLYDYWYSDIAPAGPVPAGLIQPAPSAYAQTLNAGPGIAGTMSDHGGVALRFT
ncbi:hypothetical protein AB0I28_00075 [Phytomonospora sp. NPDC050363]|uniref:hypothetical protein n=1 Tax=Phytomonospora sp. NPDC050363 TaxID=3155642 RepID=UPI0033C5ED10